MTTTTIQSILLTQLQTVTGLPTIQRENTRVSVVNSNSPWVRETLMPARSEPLTLGQGGPRHLQGNYQIDCFFPADVGALDARSLADAVVDAFPPGFQFTDGTVIVQVEVASALQSIQAPNSKFYCVPVQVQWSCYIG